MRTEGQAGNRDEANSRAVHNFVNEPEEYTFCQLSANLELISKKKPSLITLHNLQHLNNQLTHTTLKNVELLKHFKISKTAPTCSGLRGKHHQGATAGT